MSKKTIVIIVIAVLAVAMFIGALLVSRKIKASKGRIEPVDEAELERQQSVLTCLNDDDIKRYIENTEWKGDSFNYYEDGFYALYGVDVLGFNGDVETEVDTDGKIKYLTARIYVFPELVSEGEHEHDETDETEPLPEPDGYYEFSAEDKVFIEQRFTQIRDALARYLNCGEMEKYDLIPTLLAGVGEFDRVENDDRFYAGEYTREYSVRDRDGTLWFLTVEASFGTASATIYKAVDTTDYDGFWPIIDMTKPE